MIFKPKKTVRNNNNNEWKQQYKINNTTIHKWSLRQYILSKDDTITIPS